MKDFLRKWLTSRDMRKQFPDPAQRRAVAESAFRRQEARKSTDFYDVAHAVCCKGVGDIPQVQAVITLLTGPLERWWASNMQTAVDDAVTRFMELEDEIPAPTVDGLIEPEGRRRTEELLLLAFLSVLSRGASQPLSGRVDGLLSRSAERLLRDGAESVGATLDLSRDPLLRSAAKDDLRTLLAGRIQIREQELRDHAREFLRNAKARTPLAPGDIRSAPTPPFQSRSLQEWLERTTTLAGLRASEWLPQVVDQWAYRWFNVSAYRALRARRVTGFIAQAVRDNRTTPFCIWVNGRVLSVSRIDSQIDKHLRFALDGDSEALFANWPMLPGEIIRGNPVDFRRGFARVGLPPYHFFCRTRVVQRQL